MDSDTLKSSFLFISGPCVIESEAQTLGIARTLKEVTSKFDVHFVFKASFDKANRTSLSSYRGPGLEKGLEILAKVRDELGLPVTSDIHTPEQAAVAGEVLDIIQIPAFLCRQTDLLAEAARTGKVVNIKKGQFLAASDIQYAVQKVEQSGNTNILLTERGTTFGYHDLVVDFRSFAELAVLGHPVIFDATHSVQRPGLGGTTGGDREYVEPLIRAATAFGINGIFAEAHPNPPEALSDGANSLYLDSVAGILRQIEAIRSAVSGDEKS